MQEAIKERVKRWLRDERQSREWLAEKVGVEKRTVDNWLSSPRAIPHKALLIIERLMVPSEEAQQSPEAPESVLTIRVDEDRFDAYNRASLAEGLTIREWMVSVLDDAAAKEPASKPYVPSFYDEDYVLKAAEEPATYGEPQPQKKPEVPPDVPYRPRYGPRPKKKIKMTDLESIQREIRERERELRDLTETDQEETPKTQDPKDA